MARVIGIRFKRVGKIYYFAPNDQELQCGDKVIVETSRGTECGEVVLEEKEILDDKIVSSLKKVIRKANKKDLDKVDKMLQKAEKAKEICEEKIKLHKLDMKLIDAEYTFDGNKILFYFTSESRIDFRELVKDLAAIFKTRIELRQIGVRDESKVLGGLGVCGRPLCCSSFLGEFQPVSIKMAKEQNLSLNPTKISGTCGRLMCCLKYEQDAYTDLLKKAPKIGAIVDTKEGQGTVIDQNLITGKLKVRLDRTPEAAPIIFELGDVKIIKDGKIKMKKEELENFKEIE